MTKHPRHLVTLVMLTVIFRPDRSTQQILVVNLRHCRADQIEVVRREPRHRKLTHDLARLRQRVAQGDASHSRQSIGEPTIQECLGIGAGDL